MGIPGRLAGYEAGYEAGLAMDRLRAMEIFVRVAERGSFSRAAESLDLANATVTTCIRNLEQHLGVTLIHRDTRRLHLTEEGAMFLDRAKEILGTVEQAESELQAHLGAPHGALAIEVQISIGHALLCPAMPQFAARHPGITAAITLTNQPHHLIERAIDVAIRMDRVEDADLVARPIYEAAYKICCTPALASTLPDDPAQLDPRLCLGLLPEERRSSNPWHLERGDETRVIHPEGPLHFNSTDALLQAARHGGGVIHALDLFVNRAIDAGELVQVYADWQTVSKTFYAVTTKAGTTSAKVRAFTDFLTEVLDSERRPSAARSIAVRALSKR
jgi:LysR family transcriptional regulator for bpeEF and oprC